MKNTLSKRRALYCDTSTRLSQFDNKQLQKLLKPYEKNRIWSTNQVIKLGRVKVFVKRLRVTEIEYENMFSTKNLYSLPTYYNYGVGSAGLGVHREIVAHIKTTNWVLDGRIDHFPLLYHYRFMPINEKGPRIDIERHQKYVKYWNGNKNIDRYVKDRAHARYEVVQFIEYIPHVLKLWLEKDLSKIDGVIEQMQNTLHFLYTNGIIHFDCNLWNIITDGETVYLTDFGLVLDKEFQLTTRERAFFRENTYYDFGNFLSCLDNFLPEQYWKAPGSRSGSFTEEYLLLEQVTRSSSFYRRNAPGEGLLLWHIRPQANGNGDETSKSVDLICADGLYADSGFPRGHRPDQHFGRDNLDFWAHDTAYARATGGNFGDATDLFA